MTNLRLWLMTGAAALLVSCGGDKATPDDSAPEETQPEVVEEMGPKRLAPALISTGWPDLETPVLPEQVGLTGDGIGRFREAIAAAVAERGAEGMTALLLRDGHVAAYVASGSAPGADAPAGADTVWSAPALAAPVMSVGLLMLYDSGQFDLEEPVAYYLPEGRLGPVGSEDRSPTIAELLAGDGIEPTDLALQAEVIRHVSGDPVAVYLDERIFKQLGMTSMELVEGAGGELSINTSLRDAARFAQMLAGGGALGGARLIDGGTAREMAADRLQGAAWALNSGLGEDLTPGTVGRGLGVAVLRQPGVTGPGASAGSYFAAGEGSFLLVDPGQGLALVGLGEGTGGRDGDAAVFRGAASAAYGAIVAE